VWEHAQANLKALPEVYRALTGAPAYPVEFSPALRALRAEAARHVNQAAIATAVPGVGTGNGNRRDAEDAEDQKE
jgi:hypothetical protein